MTTKTIVQTIKKSIKKDKYLINTSYIGIY